MKRPIGVILTSVVLGLFALLQLFAVLGMALAAATAGRASAYAPQYPEGFVPPAVSMTRIILMAEGLFFLLLAAWAIATIAGLLKLKNWARYSVMVIGGCLAALALLSLALGALMVTVLSKPNALPSMPGSQPLPPHLMQGILAAVGLFYVAMLAVGVWWLVYFNLRSVKAYFVRKLPVYAAAGFVPTGEPVYRIDANTFPQMPPPLVYAPPPPPGRISRVPVGVTVIAVLFFLGAVCALIDTVMPFPAIVLGFVLAGAAAHVFFLAAAILSAAIGWGLLRLDNRARIAVYVLLGWGLLNGVVMVTPWGMHRMTAYMDQMYRGMGVPAMISPGMFMTWPMMAFSIVIWAAVAFAVWAILHGARAAFTRVVEPDQAAG